MRLLICHGALMPLRKGRDRHRHQDGAGAQQKRKPASTAEEDTCAGSVVRTSVSADVSLA